MARREILTCDRCGLEVLALWHVDFGNDYPLVECNSKKERITREICTPCWKAVVEFMKPLSVNA